jgi:hypothetical protein
MMDGAAARRPAKPSISVLGLAQKSTRSGTRGDGGSCLLSLRRWVTFFLFFPFLGVVPQGRLLGLGVLDYGLELLSTRTGTTALHVAVWCQPCHWVLSPSFVSLLVILKKTCPSSSLVSSFFQSFLSVISLPRTFSAIHTCPDRLGYRFGRACNPKPTSS